MSKKYKKLLFDLDNTLVNDDENRKYAIKKILLERGEEAADKRAEEFIKFDTQFWQDRVAGKIKDPYEFKTKKDEIEWIRAYRFIKFLDNVTLEEGMKINHKYIEYLKQHIIPIKNAKETLKYLYENKYEIYIVTNSPTNVIKDKLSKIEVLQYVKNTFSSEEVGYMKPHKKFYNGFFQKINCCNTEEMLIIGDELEKDIIGGIQNGIDTCWFNPHKLQNNQYKTNYEISELIELKNIL